MIPYLQVENLTKSYGELVLFEDISFSVMKDQKMALIAKNGTGKTSLLDIINGKDTADNGLVTFKNDISIGYLEQNPKVDNEKTVIEQVFANSNEVLDAVREYENAIHSGDEKLMQTAIEKMDLLQAWDYEAKIKIILTQLKITDFDKKVGTLSGGQKKRLAMANLLINEPDLLILDEPTNHLDVELIEWLEEFLTKSNSTLLMVTHDRYFLDRVCDQIIEIDNNTVYAYNGNYSYFLEKREERIQLYNQSIDKAKNLFQKELEWARRMPKARTGKAKYRMDNVEKLEEKSRGKIVDKDMELNVLTRRVGKKILDMKNISKSFGDLKIIEDFTYNFVNGEKIGIVGKNGVGKTTFLNLLTEELSPDSGEIDKGQTIVYGYYKQSGLVFDKTKKVIDIIQDIADIVTLGDGRRVSSSQFLEYFLFPAKMHYNVVEKLSGGELKRLYLMTVLMKNPNFLILDEPTNDLDIMTLNVLEEYLQSFNGCVIIVSHDRYFMDKVVDSLFVFEGDAEISSFVGKYTEYYVQKLQKEKEEKQAEKKEKPKKEKPQREKSDKLTFNEKRLFEQLETEILKLEQKKEELEQLLSSGSLNHEEITQKAEELSKIKDDLDEKEMIWLELSERV
ncbi:MAG: ABC-F family ATP-binding cassette domain-containing protein [Bacteroidales bacterium]|nr:ABC-F family ATP-binding cassette domain-containing protein [Bacteroidales bacterium]